MISKKEVAIKYIDSIERGNKIDLLKLFAKNGSVDSPVYSVMKATDFYNKINKNSTFQQNLKGIFEENQSNKIVLYFSYKRTMKNSIQADFDVVEILEFNQLNQINKIKIIYDTGENNDLNRVI